MSSPCSEHSVSTHCVLSEYSSPPYPYPLPFPFPFPVPECVCNGVCTRGTAGGLNREDTHQWN